MANEGAIILGEGVFSIGGVDIALCRGGGQFTVEREYRQITADGDRGPVKGRVRITGSVARLTMRALEVIPENLPKLYPATKVTTGTDGKITFEAKPEIEATDYNTVTWTGRTADGRAVIITLENALNMNNINWSMADKDEVVQEAIYTATYDPEDRTKEPWKVEFANA